MKIEKFTGLVNTDDPKEVGLNTLQTAVNVDITRQGRIKRRPGSSKLYDGPIQGMWSDQDGQVCIFQEGQAVVQARYWRCQAASVSWDYATPNIFKVGSFNAFTSTDGTGDDLVTTGICTASSADGAHVASLLNDGDPATYWQSTDAALPWWQVDFGNDQVIKSLSLTFINVSQDNYPLASAPQSITIQFSIDGVIWQDIKTIAIARTDMEQLFTRVQVDPALMLWNGSTATTITNDVSAMLSTSRLSGVFLNNKTYWSNGLETGVVVGVGNRSWGLAIPSHQPVLTIGVGQLKAGRYLVAVVYVRDDGQEGPATKSAIMELVDIGGIVFDDIPVSTDVGVSKVAIYLSTTDSPTLRYLVAVDNGTTTFTYSGDGHELGRELISQFLVKPPSGSILAYHHGRILIASGEVIWFTEPLQFELINPTTGFIALPAPITLLASVQGGVYCATQFETFFLAGTSPEDMILQSVAGYGVVPGTMVMTDASMFGDGSISGAAAVWTSNRGVCVGFPGGIVQNLTQSRYSFPTGQQGAAIFREYDGQQHYICTQQGQPLIGHNPQI